MHVRETKAGDGVVPETPKATVRIPPAVVRAYERFFGQPVALVLAALWVAGATLLVSAALVLYLAGWDLVRAVTGIP